MFVDTRKEETFEKKHDTTQGGRVSAASRAWGNAIKIEKKRQLVENGQNMSV